MKNRSWTNCVVIVLSSLLLAACSDATPSVIPTRAEFGGVSAIRRDTDNDIAEADLSVSALDADDNVLNRGTITNPTVDTNSLTVLGLATQQYMPTRVSADVCGDVEPAPQTGPITAALTLDGSGSMSGNDPNQLRNGAAKGFVTRLRPQDQAAIGWFTDGRGTAPYDNLRVEQDFTDDQQRLNDAIDRATVARSGTPLWDAVVDTVALLDTVSTSNSVAVILTDGEDTSSSNSVQDAIDAAQASNTVIYTVGLTSGTDRNLSRLASETGGTFQTVVDPNDLTESFFGIFSGAQASGCITIEFVPIPPDDTVVEGDVNFQVNGTPLGLPFRVQF